MNLKVMKKHLIPKIKVDFDFLYQLLITLPADHFMFNKVCRRKPPYKTGLPCIS